MELNQPVKNSQITLNLKQLLKSALGWHQAGELQKAESAYRQILEKQPDNDEALHLMGVLLHQTGRDELAEQVIHAAIKLDSSNDTYYFNLAEIQRAIHRPEVAIHNYRNAIKLESNEADYFFGLGSAFSDTSNWQQATEAFDKALILSPGDSQIHNNLGNALAEMGEYNQAIEHFHKAIALQPAVADSYFNLALALDETEAFDDAIAAYQKALSLNPDIPQALANLGRLHRQANNLANAEKNYQQALELKPNLHSALMGLAAVYRDIGDYVRALRYYQQLLDARSDDVIALTLLGDCLAKLDRYEEALEQIKKALVVKPDNAESHFGLGTCLQALGRFDEAAQSHRKALSLQPDLTEAAYNLVLIDSQSLGENDLEKLSQRSADESLDESTRINLHFALAKAYHDRGSYDKAFTQLRVGNDIKSKSNPFSPEVYEDYIERIITVLDKAFFESHIDYGLETEVPIIIVGMPRSGSTLVEQIISSHAQAYGAGELNDMRILAKRIPEIMNTQQQEPECLADISREIIGQLANEHLRKLNNLSNGADRVCDKMLGNFLKLGLIYLMFPRARIIHCQRNPLDTGLSCYFQNFARGLRFTYDLEHLGIAYRGYLKVMEHWRQVLPMQMLEVSYERMISDQEATSRELIEFCGLDWDENCLDFHQQQRGVKTASFWQVRQPIYKSSVSRWRHYERQLEPLIKVLGDKVDDIIGASS